MGTDMDGPGPAGLAPTRKNEGDIFGHVQSQNVRQVHSKHVRQVQDIHQQYMYGYGHGRSWSGWIGTHTHTHTHTHMHSRCTHFWACGAATCWAGSIFSSTINAWVRSRSVLQCGQGRSYSAGIVIHLLSLSGRLWITYVQNVTAVD
jgi:hypothetical protein